MFSQDDDGHGLVLTLVFGLMALVIALVIGVSIYQRGDDAFGDAIAATSAVAVVRTAAPSSVTAAAVIVPTVDAASAAQAASDAASIKVEKGAVRFYFASGKAELAAGAGDALSDVVRGASSGQKLVITGYHDATGDTAKNAALARQRAIAVRDALLAAGVPARQIELKKPEQLSGEGSNAEARRVEVTLQ